MARKPAGMKRRAHGRPNERELADLASGITDVPEQLDLVHVTAVGYGKDIVACGQIETRECDVFGRRLVYAFLARPAYRFHDGATKSDQISRFPMVFVISPGNLGTPFHAYPFDTGAACSGVFGDPANQTRPLEDYDLGPNLDAARRHVSWAFGSNRNYYDGALKPGLAGTLRAYQMAATGFLTVAGLAATGHNQPDKRASAIEIAYDKHVPLRGNVRLVVLPQQFIEDGGERNIAFVRQLEALGLAWETYDWRPNEAPDFYLDEITRIVRDFLERSGQL